MRTIKLLLVPGVIAIISITLIAARRGNQGREDEDEDGRGGKIGKGNRGGKIGGKAGGGRDGGIPRPKPTPMVACNSTNKIDPVCDTDTTRECLYFETCKKQTNGTRISPPKNRIFDCPNGKYCCESTIKCN